MIFTTYESLLLLAAVCCLAEGVEIIQGDDGRTLVIETLNSDDGGKLFYTNVVVGDEHKQTMKMVVGTYGRKHWIRNSEKAQLLDLRDNDGTNNTLSLGDYIQVQGKMHMMTIQIAGLEFNTQKVLLAKRVIDRENNEDANGLDYDGVVAIGDLFWIDYRATDEQLLDRATGVNKGIFSLYFNKSYVPGANSGVQGALIFGGTERRFYRGEIKYVEYKNSDLIGHQYDQSFGIKDVPLSGMRLEVTIGDSFDVVKSYNYRVKSVVRFDSSSIYSVLDPLMAQYIHGILNGVQIGDSFYLISCHPDGMPTIVFKLGYGGQEIVVKPEDYIVRFDGNNSTTCHSAFRTTANMAVKVNMFGTHIMKNYFTVFDYYQDVNRIGFAEAA